MANWTWKDLLTNRDRRQFPEVVVPLADAPAPEKPISHPYAEKKAVSDDDSNSSLDRASSQEKGTVLPTSYTTLTLEALRAHVESDIAASGHDSVYDRTLSISSEAPSDTDWPPLPLPGWPCPFKLALGVCRTGSDF